MVTSAQHGIIDGAFGIALLSGMGEAPALNPAAVSHMSNS